MKKSQFDIPVKMLLPTAEYLEFRDACIKADVKHSPLLRKLTRNWMAQQKNSGNAEKKEWPEHGQHMALQLPGRVSYGMTPVRMRV